MKVMPTESSLRSEPHEAIDALVEGPSGAFEIRSEDIYRPPLMFRFEQPAPAQYVVPSRFGMSGIIGIMTGLAVLFGAFRIYNAPPMQYLLFGTQAIVICVAQMFYGKRPRAASAVSGAIFLPLFLAIGAAYSGNHRVGEDYIYICMLIGSVPVGAFFGYVTGTMAAGVFLIMDAAEWLMVGGSVADLSGAAPLIANGRDLGRQ
jgi:hypothetical protein